MSKQTEVPLDFPDECNVCSKSSIQRCQRCKLSFYCSKQCQRNDWYAGHKTICKPYGTDIESSSDESSHLMMRNMSKMVRQKVNIPKFHEEYKSVYKNNDHFVDNFLEHSFHSQVFSQNKCTIEGYMDRFTFIKRWGYYEIDKVQQFVKSNPSYGDILERNPPEYGTIAEFQTSKEVYDLMSNSQKRNIPHTIGKVYVGVGFLDLHQLLMADFIFPSSGELKTPLVFVGYDKSEICIARSLIVYEMMKAGCEPKSILQVWFSTAWNETTQAEFKQTCCSLIDKNELRDHSFSGRVLELIKYWNKSKISTETSQLHWHRKFSSRQLCVVSNLNSKLNRVQYIRYLVSGQLFETDDSTYRHGNVTMFKLPSSFANYLPNESNLFATISQSTQSELKTTDKIGIVDSLCAFLTEKMTVLRKLVHEGDIVCKFRQEKVTLSRKDLLSDIKELQPALIDWSNILDYFSKADMLSITLLCSGADTLHCCHFMNWLKYVYGASIVDYGTEKEKTYLRLKTEMDKLFNEVKDDIPFLRKDNYYMFHMNLVDKLLATKYHGVFVKFLFDKEKYIKVKAILADSLNFFEHSNTTFHILFSYKNLQKALANIPY